MDMVKVLVIEDEVQIRKLLTITLESNHYDVRCVNNAKEGLLLARENPPNIILLDLGLPDEDGQVVLKKLREWYTEPIIILSVRDSEAEIIEALNNGANDYLPKPFRTDDLIARMRSAQRNFKQYEREPLTHFGEFEIDYSSRTVRKNGESIELTLTEYSLLSLFAKQEGRVLTQQYLLREIWGVGYINQSQYLRAYIAQLRKKIEQDPNRPVLITTVSGIGYRFIGK